MKKLLAVLLTAAICCTAAPPRVQAAAVPFPMPPQEIQPVFVRLHPEKQPPQPAYTEEELYILSHVICGEAGSSWISDEEQLLVANVVMNRVASPAFPNTIQEVVFQPGQYACTWDGNYNRQPDERTIANAVRILQGERFCPPDVLYQSNSQQGRVYKKIGATYFCYGN